MSKVYNSFKHALNGVTHVLKTQSNMRRSIILAIAFMLAGFALHFTPLELILLLIPIIFMLVSEMFNTAAEISADLVGGKKYHPVIKVIKDITAGAVLIALTGLCICFLILFIDHIPCEFAKYLSKAKYFFPPIGIFVCFVLLLSVIIRHK